MLLSWRGFREHARGVLHLDEEPSRLATGMAVGVFIGCTPFYGLHTLLALLVAVIFRLNKVATVTGAWINLPFFAPFVYAFALRLGEAILSRDFSSFSWASVLALAEGARAYLQVSPRQGAGDFLRLLWDMLFVASKPLLVGTGVIGLMAGFVTYFVTLEAIRDVRRLRHRRHPRPAPGDLSQGDGRRRP